MSRRDPVHNAARRVVALVEGGEAPWKEVLSAITRLGRSLRTADRTREKLGETGYAVGGLTMEEVVAYFQANPILGLELRGRLKIAGPWEQAITNSDRWFRGSSDATVRETARGWEWQACRRAARTLSGLTIDGGVCETREAAFAAADAALVAQGWALADSR